MDNLSILRGLRLKSVNEEGPVNKPGELDLIEDLPVPKEEERFRPFFNTTVILLCIIDKEINLITKVEREFPLPYKKMIFCATQTLKIWDSQTPTNKLPIETRLSKNYAYNQIIMRLLPYMDEPQIPEERAICISIADMKDMCVRRVKPTEVMIKNNKNLITAMDRIPAFLSIPPYYHWSTNQFFECYEQKILSPELTDFFHPYMLKCLPFVDDTCPIVGKAIAGLPLIDVKNRYLQLGPMDQIRFLSLMENETVVKLAGILSPDQKMEMISFLDEDRYEALYQLDHTFPTAPSIAEGALRELRAAEAKLAKKRRQRLRLANEEKDDGVASNEDLPEREIREETAPRFEVHARREPNRLELAKLNRARGPNRRSCTSHITMWKGATYESARGNPIFIHYQGCTKEEFALERVYHMTAEFFVRIMADHQEVYAQSIPFEDRNGDLKPGIVFTNVKLEYKGRLIYQGAWRVGHEADEPGQPRGKVYHSYPDRGGRGGLSNPEEMQDDGAPEEQNLFEVAIGSLFIMGEVGGEITGRLQLGEREDDFMLITCLPIELE